MQSRYDCYLSKGIKISNSQSLDNKNKNNNNNQELANWRINAITL